MITSQAFRRPDRISDDVPLVVDRRSTNHLSLPPEALYGIAGEFVREFEPYTEADPAALLFQFNVAFGNMIGPNPFVRVGASQHRTNLYMALIGATSTARKGTSWDCVAKLVKLVDPEWFRNCRISGLGSGEALIAAVKDPDPISHEELSKSEPHIPQSLDKRGLVQEGEFASILEVCRREGNTLNSTIRNAWDSGDLRVTTKRDSLKATGAHISIVAHCTEFELASLVSTTDMFNGVANRFLWVTAKRSKLLPIPGLPSEFVLKSLVERVASASSFAKVQGEIKFSSEAEDRWRFMYPLLVRERPAIQGALTARAAPIVLRLAAIYALLDCSSKIEPDHLKAALGCWEYSEKSVGHIFGNATGDKNADRLIRALEDSPEGLTQTQILEDVFGGNMKKDRVATVLAHLLRFGLIRSTSEKSQTGRKVIRWSLTDRIHEFNELSGQNSLNSCISSSKTEGV